MKVTLFSLLIGFYALAARGAGIQIAYVDMQKALYTVEAGKSAKSAFDKELTKKRSDLESAQKKLQKEAEEFEKKSALLNASAKAAKQAELQKRFADFQRSAAESQMELQKRERELTKPILDELRSVIGAIGKEKGYQLVIQKGDNNDSVVLYAESGSDITDEVISRFNSANKKKKG